MPPAKKPTSTSSRARTFKEPPALKRLSKSLDAAYEALAELQGHARRDVSQGAHAVYKDVRTFVTSARRDTGKLAKALARDFDQAEKQLARSGQTGSARAKAAPMSSRKPQSAAKRSTGKR
jgi:hypothetical protein